MPKFDMNAMLKQAQQMQAQMLEAQEQAKQVACSIVGKPLPARRILQEL